MKGDMHSQCIILLDVIMMYNNILVLFAYDSNIRVDHLLTFGLWFGINSETQWVSDHKNLS
jgi:hypothetical protein